MIPSMEFPSAVTSPVTVAGTQLVAAAYPLQERESLVPEWN
jgi:hypothetical protein